MTKKWQYKLLLHAFILVAELSDGCGCIAATFAFISASSDSILESLSSKRNLKSFLRECISDVISVLSDRFCRPVVLRVHRFYCPVILRVHRFYRPDLNSFPSYILQERVLPRICGWTLKQLTDLVILTYLMYRFCQLQCNLSLLFDAFLQIMSNNNR